MEIVSILAGTAICVGFWALGYFTGQKHAWRDYVEQIERRQRKE